MRVDKQLEGERVIDLKVLCDSREARILVQGSERPLPYSLCTCRGQI